MWPPNSLHEFIGSNDFQAILEMSDRFLRQRMLNDLGLRHDCIYNVVANILSAELAERLSVAQFVHQQDFERYFFTSVRNALADEFRRLPRVSDEPVLKEARHSDSDLAIDVKDVLTKESQVLNEQEKLILKLCLESCTTGEIAVRLQISPGRVSQIRKQISAKLLAHFHH